MEIYGLIDPRTCTFFYVGKSKDAKKRFTWHLRECNAGHCEPLSTAHEIYIYRMLKNGIRPVMTILDNVNKDEVNQIEWEWALTLKLIGHPITNRLTHMVKGKSQFVKEQLKNIAA